MNLKKFIAYLGKNEVPFKDFDALLMRNYHIWLKNQELGRNTISLYIRNLKRVYKLAVNDGLRHRINYNLKKLGEIMDLGYPLNLTVARHSWESMAKSVSISDIL